MVEPWNWNVKVGRRRRRSGMKREVKVIMNLGVKLMWR